MPQIQITSTAAKALNLLPNKKGEYTIERFGFSVSGQQLADVCQHYEMLIKCKLQEQKEKLSSQLTHY